MERLKHGGIWDFFRLNQGASSALQWWAIPENIIFRKIGNIVTLQLGYHGWFKHHEHEYEYEYEYEYELIQNQIFSPHQNTTE